MARWRSCSVAETAQKRELRVQGNAALRRLLGCAPLVDRHPAHPRRARLWACRSSSPSSSASRSGVTLAHSEPRLAGTNSVPLRGPAVGVRGRGERAVPARPAAAPGLGPHAHVRRAREAGRARRVTLVMISGAGRRASPAPPRARTSAPGRARRDDDPPVQAHALDASLHQEHGPRHDRDVGDPHAVRQSQLDGKSRAGAHHGLVPPDASAGLADCPRSRRASGARARTRRRVAFWVAGLLLWRRRPRATPRAADGHRVQAHPPPRSRSWSRSSRSSTRSPGGCLTPPLQTPDEPVHVYYVQYLAETARCRTPGRRRTSPPRSRRSRPACTAPTSSPTPTAAATGRAGGERARPGLNENESRKGSGGDADVGDYPPLLLRGARDPPTSSRCSRTPTRSTGSTRCGSARRCFAGDHDLLRGDVPARAAAAAPLGVVAGRRSCARSSRCSRSSGGSVNPDAGIAAASAALF